MGSAGGTCPHPWWTGIQVRLLINYCSTKVSKRIVYLSRPPRIELEDDALVDLGMLALVQKTLPPRVLDESQEAVVADSQYMDSLADNEQQGEAPVSKKRKRASPSTSKKPQMKKMKAFWPLMRVHSEGLICPFPSKCSIARPQKRYRSAESNKANEGMFMDQV